MAAKPGPLVAIVGPTASGKSAVAMELARQFNSEVICADARTIYRGMDIGTAKPPAADQTEVPHHLLNVVEPSQQFTVAQFKELALRAIEDIQNRGKLPIIVGGTGLYVDSVLYDFQFRAPADPVLRAELEQMSVEELQERISSLGLPLPTNDRNPRHLIRALETNGEVGQRRPLREHTLVLGMDIEPELLREHIAHRTKAMIEVGLENEARQLAAEYGEEAPGLTAIGYREWFEADDPAAAIEKDTRAYAKRQKTWFKRNKSIHWISNPADAVAIVTTFLNKSTQ